MSDCTRRDFIKGASAAAVLAATGARPTLALPRPVAGGPVVISSGNGLPATEKAMALLGEGADPLDAAIAGVNIVEDDPEDMSVGYGGLPNEHGVVQLDSCVMHGPTGKAGSVASLENIKNPSQVARLVMQRTDHVILVGPGALAFARAHGFEEMNLLTDKSRKAWLRWKENLSPSDDWISPEESGIDGERSTGTINCCALDRNGALGGVTTTSGLAFKIPGRVGDSPIIGAGLYVDNEVGAAGATGRGEAVILNCGSFAIVELMRNGRSPQEACLEILKRIADKNHDKRLQKPDGKPNFQVTFYALSRTGEFGSACLWKGRKFAVHDGKENRLLESAWLYEEK
jgi:N4-(beta-N-acetylglucosaminyl)-L-asparaginase